MWDAFPVNRGHALVITHRHVPDWHAASNAEKHALIEAVEAAIEQVHQRHRPDGINIGVNVRAAAGQTVPHLHLHVIPRYWGDVPDPRGGVRHVIPSRGSYLPASESAQPAIPVAAVNGLESAPMIEPLGIDLRTAIGADLAVAFVTESGLSLLEPHLLGLLERGGRLRLLTGDYLSVTEPRALRRLLDWQRQHDADGQSEGRIELRVFETGPETGFHPKLYVVWQPGDRVNAYVGSSNLTRHALAAAIEWNQRISGRRDEPPILEIRDRFERLFIDPRTATLTDRWIDAYARRRGMWDPIGRPPPEPAAPVPIPHVIQARALEALAKTRQAGNRAGLVVLATGLGKTWLAAFDSTGFDRVLFIAHRREILAQAMRSFRHMRPDAHIGLYGGGQLDQEADILFASVQTLSQPRHLERFAPDRFDYIVIDEFHHAEARTYRRLIDHFEPQFLLGLTATPDRSDGGDLLLLCSQNLVYRCDLAEGIAAGLLVPFHYFGVPDDVDFSNIPWRNGRFDEVELERHVATGQRARSALQEWRKHGQTRALGFCVSQRHADFMADYFRRHGVRALAVHSGSTSAPRAYALEQLADGDIEVVFTVDLFNEGLDVPGIDTVIMLRPTESRIVWLQQFGRGLRKSPHKTHLTVIDYVGNHRTFLQVAMLLLAPGNESQVDLALALERLERGDLTLPPGCLVRYELEARNILQRMLEPTGGADRLEYWYRLFADRHGRRPTAGEVHQSGHDLRWARQRFGSWPGMVASLGGFNADEAAAFQAHREFLEALHTTPLTRSYKVVVLLAMIAGGRFPGSISLDDLAAAVKRIVGRSRVLLDDFGIDLEDAPALHALLEKNPIRAWAAGDGMGGVKYFSYEDGRLATRGLDAHPQALADLVREMCDWRLAQYLDRLRTGEQPAG